MYLHSSPLLPFSANCNAHSLSSDHGGGTARSLLRAQQPSEMTQPYVSILVAPPYPTMPQTLYPQHPWLLQQLPPTLRPLASTKATRMPHTLHNIVRGPTHRTNRAKPPCTTPRP